MTSDFNKKLEEILDYLGESYYPMHEYPDQPIYTDRNKEAINEATTAIKNLMIESLPELNSHTVRDLAHSYDPDHMIPECCSRVQGYNQAIAHLKSLIEGEENESNS